jgi:polysaccharide biosynthesis transport protein
MSDNPPRRETGADAAARPAESRRARPVVRTTHPPVVRTARDYWIMFRERWYWGLLAGVIVGSILGFWRMQQPPIYGTMTTLMFENPAQILEIRPVNPGVVGGGEINLAMHIQRMSSGSFRSYVAHALTPQEAETIRHAYLDPELPPSDQVSLEDILSNSIEIVEGKNAPILEIHAFHRDPVAAELIANRFARRYIDFNLDQAANSTNSAAILLEEEEGKLRKQLQDSQTRLQEYREQHNTVSLAENQNVVVQRLTNISNQLINAHSELTALESTLSQIDALEKSGGDLVQVSYVSSFGSVATLLQDLDTLKAERALLEQRYLENHPKMQASTRAIETKTQLIRDNVARAVTELRNSLARAREHQDRLVEQQREAERQSYELEKTANAFNVLRRESESISALYENVLRRRKEMMIATSMNNVNIQVLDRAWVPSKPAEPKPMAIALQSGVLGMFFLVAIPLGLGMIDVRLKAAWEVEQFLNQNLLGEVPAISGVPRKERAHLMSRDLDHAASEAFRGLFGQIQLNSTVPYPKVIMITSTLPGEGKSMIANNLAATFAAHGKRTLLLDCDLRRPNLHLFYGKDNACGLLRWLNGAASLAGPAEDDPELGILPVRQNLFLLRSGGEFRRATELFEMAMFSRLLSRMREQFEVVLVDTPPLGVFPDGMLISKNCDEVVYVCRFNAVNRSKIRKSLDRLQRTSAVLSGIILNGIPTGKQSAYYDYYGYGSNENKRYKAYYAQKR